MRQTYETDFRPNFEIGLASVWGVGALTSSTAMMAVTQLQLLPAIFLSSPFIATSLYYATIARNRHEKRAALQRKTLNFYSLEELEAEMQPSSLFIGRGFSWDAKEAQKVQDLSHTPDLMEKILEEGNGATYLHGIGAEDEESIYLTDDVSKGHTHIVGTTGAGKTRLFDLLISQAILRNEPVIILDPKGDKELKNNAEAAYQRLGRGQDFTFFHPAFPDESAAINPLANFQRESELASRLAAVVPATGSGEVFKSFGQNALMGIFFAVLISGKKPTISDVQRTLSQGFGPLVVRALKGWAENSSPDILDKLNSALSKERDNEKKAEVGAAFYTKLTDQNPEYQISEMNTLISSLRHDPTHFQKMVASLVPVVGQLCSGPLSVLLSPDPTAGRMPKSGKVISMASVIEDAGGAYIGLDTLSDPLVGRAMGQMIMADLAALAGQQYNFGKGEKFVNIFIDEASEVTNEQLVQLLNKGRGANFRLFVATQTLADYEARTESSAMASVIMANMNNTFMLRTIDPDTQKRLSERLPEVPLHYVMKTTSSSMSDGGVNTGGFDVSHGERLMHEDKPLIAPQLLGQLSDLEYFLVSAKGDVYKGRLPILEAPENHDESPKNARYAQMQSDRTYDDIAKELRQQAIGLDTDKKHEEQKRKPHTANRFLEMVRLRTMPVVPGIGHEEKQNGG